MMDNFPLDHLRKHLLENHDSDWMFEYIDFDGLAMNCYLPTDSPETYIIVDWGNYAIRDTGQNMPQGLVDEITTVLEDGLKIYVGWEGTNLPEEWA